MKKENKKEEIQSRREFFKVSAKKLLPIVGVIALSSMPFTSKATSLDSTSCDGSCVGYCYGACGTACSTSCVRSCKDYCDGSCKGTCLRTCAGGCSGNSKY